MTFEGFPLTITSYLDVSTRRSVYEDNVEKSVL